MVFLPHVIHAKHEEDFRIHLTFNDGTEGTVAVARLVLHKDPMDGALFVFRNKARHMLRLLYYDGSGFWLTTTKYLTPAGTPLHEKGLEPTVAVDTPDVEFGQPEPTTDPILEKALEKLAEKKAA